MSASRTGLLAGFLFGLAIAVLVVMIFNHH